MTHRTEAITRGAADGDTFSHPRDLLEQREQSRLQTGQQRCSRLRRLGQRGFLDGQFAGEGSLGADFFLLRGENGLVLLNLGCDEHPLSIIPLGPFLRPR